MKEYVFENLLNSNIEIKIKAINYTEAIEILLIEVKYIEDYKLKSV